MERTRRRGDEPALFLNPTGDAAFAGEVERLMGEGMATAGELQHALRASYPRAVVRPRGLANEPFPVWYVYREGHWVAST